MEGLYELRNNSNGKFYIGRTNNIMRRLREHKNDEKTHLKLGEMDFDNLKVTFIHLKGLHPDRLDFLETFVIQNEYINDLCVNVDAGKLNDLDFGKYNFNNLFGISTGKYNPFQLASLMKKIDDIFPKIKQHMHRSQKHPYSDGKKTLYLDHPHNFESDQNWKDVLKLYKKEMKCKAEL